VIPMKAILITPSAFPNLTGNAVTVDRISCQLSSHGIDCRIIDLSRASGDQALAESLSFKPDIVHAFHAFKAGRTALTVAKALAIPLITTMTGTDLYIDLHTESKTSPVKEVLINSQAVTVFNEDGFSVLRCEKIPEDKIYVIHQSPFLPDVPVVDLRKELGISERSIVFLLAGAVRRVKNYGLAVDVLKRIRGEHPLMHLLIAGAAGEEDEFQRVRRKISGEDWITYLGEVPRTSMRSLYHSVDAVLNTSDSESENNVIIEAMSCGCIVIGRDIRGNHSLLEKNTGFLFRSEEELKEIIIHVAENLDRLEFLKDRVKYFAETNFSFALEKKSYIELYESLM
jgi:L-malate glycosyltransferase